MDLNLFPWSLGESPYWTNPNNGLEWYVDKFTSDSCHRIHVNGWPSLDALVFLVVERKGEEIFPLERVMIHKKTNEVLACEKSFEAMVAKINWFRLNESCCD